MTVELDEDFLFALLEFVKFKDAAWKVEPEECVCCMHSGRVLTFSILIQHPNDIPEPDLATAKADVFFETLQLQPVSLELSFMRTDRVNVDDR